MVTKCVYLYQYKTGNSIPKSRGKIIMCTSAAAIRARSTKTRNRDLPAGKPRLMSVEQ